MIFPWCGPTLLQTSSLLAVELRRGLATAANSAPLNSVSIISADCPLIKDNAVYFSSTDPANNDGSSTLLTRRELQQVSSSSSSPLLSITNSSSMVVKFALFNVTALVSMTLGGGGGGGLNASAALLVGNILTAQGCGGGGGGGISSTSPLKSFATIFLALTTTTQTAVPITLFSCAQGSVSAAVGPLSLIDFGTRVGTSSSSPSPFSGGGEVINGGGGLSSVAAASIGIFAPLLFIGSVAFILYLQMRLKHLKQLKTDAKNKNTATPTTGDDDVVQFQVNPMSTSSNFRGISVMKLSSSSAAAAVSPEDNKIATMKLWSSNSVAPSSKSQKFGTGFGADEVTSPVSPSKSKFGLDAFDIKMMRNELTPGVHNNKSGAAAGLSGVGTISSSSQRSFSKFGSDAFDIPPPPPPISPTIRGFVEDDADDGDDKNTFSFTRDRFSRGGDFSSSSIPGSVVRLNHT